MKTQQQCLSDEFLDCLVHGQVSPVEEHSAQQHLDSCDDCCERMRQRVGDGQWWREAECLLTDLKFPSAQDSRLLPTDPDADRQPTAAVVAHLKQWIGATDDPSKLGRIGSFEVVGVVGVGGAGIVLKAFDARLNRFVAIKTLLPALAHSAIARRRFERESRAVAAITHQNVVPIFAVDTYNGHPYIAMHYVAGHSLQRRLDDRGPLHPIEVVRIAAQIARALAAAHAQGVIHRDIKPANILLESTIDRVLVTDFGLARVIDEAATHSGAITGTPQYMSPEQCHGQVADQRSDLFSLGSVMYAMCVGRAPFRSDTLMGMLHKVCESTPRSVRELNAEVPEWLEAFVVRLQQKHPDDRLQSAAQAADILEAELAHLQSPATVVAPTRPWLPKPNFPPRHPNLLGRFTMPLIASAFGAAFMFAIMQSPSASNANNSISIKEIKSQPSLEQVVSDGQRKLFELHEEKLFDVQPGGQLTLKADGAHVEIKTDEGKQAKVEVIRRISATAEEQAKELVSNHNVVIKQEAGNLFVDSEINADFRKSEQRNLLKQIKFIVTLPKEFNIDVQTAGGHISATDIAGKVHVSTAGGHITLANVQGPVIARTAGGHIRLGDTSGNVDAHTSGGHITLGNVNGSVEAETSGGSIKVEEVQGAISGNTSGGNIDVSISKQPSQDCQLTTHGGNIHIALAKQLTLSLNVDTNSGRIHAPFSESTDKSRNENQNLSLRHELNGGGPKLIVTTSSGNATIELIDE